MLSEQLSPTFDADMVALHRYAVIAEALPERLTPAERGALVRTIAMRNAATTSASSG